jgi:uncharacterized protein YndB with AHSA1/START domain
MLNVKGNEQIVVEYSFSESPAKVWRALTEPDFLAGWLMPNDIAPVVGHKFNFRSQPMGDWDGVVDCEVLEVVPERKLVYTWNGGSSKNEGYGHRLETTVTWTLEAQPAGGTLLKLVHHGFHPDDFAFNAMGQGWIKMGSRIEQVLGAIR